MESKNWRGKTVDIPRYNKHCKSVLYIIVVVSQIFADIIITVCLTKKKYNLISIAEEQITGFIHYVRYSGWHRCNL